MGNPTKPKLNAFDAGISSQGITVTLDWHGIIKHILESTTSKKIEKKSKKMG
jgi:hypothetical protein